MNRIMIDTAATGRNIELLLKESKMSVSRLTGLMGLTTTNAVYKWIRGETLPTPDNPVALSAVLGVAMDEIIIRKEDGIHNI